MKKLKLIVSDFHIGKGRMLEDGSLNTLEYFIYDQKFIDFLDFYCSRDFSGAEVELILNGDFLNTLQVDYRDRYPAEITEHMDVQKVKQIFEGHPELFDALRDFAATPHHSITYIAGNHDPALHWQAVRELIDQRLETQVTYPSFSYAFDGILVEHGHQYAASNRFNLKRLYLSRGRSEPILNLPWGSHFVINYLNQIKRKRSYVDRVQPFGHFLTYAMVFDTGFALRATARLIWFFLRQQFRPGKWRPEDLLITFQVLKDVSIVPRLDLNALEILKKGHYHTVIFGHNHQPAFMRLGKNRLYINTGTWNEIIYMDLPNLGRQHRMTYAVINYDEQGIPCSHLKLWKGGYSEQEDIIF